MARPRLVGRPQRRRGRRPGVHGLRRARPSAARAVSVEHAPARAGRPLAGRARRAPRHAGHRGLGRGVGVLGRHGLAHAGRRRGRDPGAHAQRHDPAQRRLRDERGAADRRNRRALAARPARRPAAARRRKRAGDGRHAARALREPAAAPRRHVRWRPSARRRVRRRPAARPDQDVPPARRPTGARRDAAVVARQRVRPGGRPRDRLPRPRDHRGRAGRRGHGQVHRPGQRGGRAGRAGAHRGAPGGGAPDRAAARSRPDPQLRRLGGDQRVAGQDQARRRYGAGGARYGGRGDAALHRPGICGCAVHPARAIRRGEEQLPYGRAGDRPGDRRARPAGSSCSGAGGGSVAAGKRGCIRRSVRRPPERASATPRSAQLPGGRDAPDPAPARA